MVPKAGWLPVMAGIMQTRKRSSYPSMLAYDRYGQGMTKDRDPQDKDEEPGRGHDVADVVTDLHQLLTQIAREQLGRNINDVAIILVANSIGGAIARLYAHAHPGTVSAMLLLDSMMANSNFDFWPNPDADDFKLEDLPGDVSVEVLRVQRAKFAAIFHPAVVNKEGLNRATLREQLPDSDKPALKGPGGKGPYLIVVGHDPDTFADESLKVHVLPTIVRIRASILTFGRQWARLDHSQCGIRIQSGTSIIKVW